MAAVSVKRSIVAQVLALKPVNFVSLTDSFILLFFNKC